MKIIFDKKNVQSGEIQKFKSGTQHECGFTAPLNVVSQRPRMLIEANFGCSLVKFVVPC